VSESEPSPRKIQGHGNPFRFHLILRRWRAADTDELIKRAGGEPGQVQDHEGESQLATKLDHSLAQLQCARHGVRFDFHACDFVVKAHAQLPEAQGAQTLFKGIHLTQAFGVIAVP